MKTERKVISANLDIADIQAMAKNERTTGKGMQSQMREAVKQYLYPKRKKKEEQQETEDLPSISEDSLLSTHPAY